MARNRAQDSIATVRESIQLLKTSLSDMESHVKAYDHQLAELQAQIDTIRAQGSLEEQSSVVGAAASVGESAEEQSTEKKAAQPRKRIVRRPSTRHEITTPTLGEEHSLASGSHRGVGVGPDGSRKKSGGIPTTAPYPRRAPRMTVTPQSQRRK